MQQRPAALVAIVLALLPACTQAYGAVSGHDSASTSKKHGSNKGDDDDDKSADADPTDPSGPGVQTGTNPITIVQPPAGSGGPVNQVAQRFPGSKAFLPQRVPAPGLLLLHGSEGGTDGTIEQDAAFYAQQGFVVVTLCWFGCSGTPSKVLRVPLDKTIDAGTWLASTVEVGGKKVGLFGWSRGGEQAVLVASLLAGKVPFATVAVHAPSDTIVSSYDPATDNGIPETSGGQTVAAPAWTFQGRDLFGERSMTDQNERGPRIEIERYPGALFVSHGMNDQLWEVGRSQRLVQSRSRVPGLVTEAHFWPGEDHMIETQQTQDAYDDAIVPFLKRELSF